MSQNAPTTNAQPKNEEPEQRPDDEKAESEASAPPADAPRPKPEEEDEIMGKAFDWTLTKRLLRFLIPYRAQVNRALILSIILAVLSLIGPYLFKVAIDEGIRAPHRQADGAIRPGNLPLLVTVTLAYLAVQFATWRAGYDQQVRLAILAQNVLFDLRDNLFGHLQSLSLDFYDRRASGRIISRLTNDIENLNEVITSGAINLVADALSLVGIIALMLWLNWRLALLTFILIPLIFLVSRLFGRRARVAFRDNRKKIATVTANLAESISGVRVTKSFGREQQNLQKFQQVNRDNMHSTLRSVLVFAIFFPVLEIIGAVGTMMVLWYGGLLVIRTHGFGATVGMLAAFLAYVERFFQPIRNTSRLYNTLQSAMASGERVFEILDTEPSVKEAPNAPDLPRVSGEVRFDHVTFAYEPGQDILHDLSLTVSPGETIAIVGPTGAGKSTFISLLARLYDPTEGRITIDGVDIKTVATTSLRGQMGIVLQDSFLFSGTVRENIAYARPDAVDEEVQRAAVLVGADRFIARLPQGYETPVEERGQRLSAGQRQLLSFARALLADPRILILDEATASIDAYTETVIQNALRELLKGRTAFVIAHRLSTIVESDRILVLQAGRIVEQGRHAELLAQNGLYAALYARQFASDEPEDASSDGADDAALAVTPA